MNIDGYQDNNKRKLTKWMTKADDLTWQTYVNHIFKNLKMMSGYCFFSAFLTLFTQLKLVGCQVKKYQDEKNSRIRRLHQTTWQIDGINVSKKLQMMRVMIYLSFVTNMRWLYLSVAQHLHIHGKKAVLTISLKVAIDQ